MRILECPKCHAVVRAVASDVAHRCPRFKNQYVAFVEIVDGFDAARGGG